MNKPIPHSTLNCNGSGKGLAAKDKNHPPIHPALLLTNLQKNVIFSTKNGSLEMLKAGWGYNINNINTLQIKDAGMNIALINSEEMDSNNECNKGWAIFPYNELLQIAGSNCKIIRGKGLDLICQKEKAIGGRYADK